MAQKGGFPLRKLSLPVDRDSKRSPKYQEHATPIEALVQAPVRAKLRDLAKSA